MHYHKDLASIVTLTITFLLFILALFTKGITHDLFLESGVFLVSLKLMITTSKIMASNDEISKKLTHIEKLIKKEKK